MSALDNIPENKNFLSPLNFRFQIKKCPNVNFFLQNVNLPGMVLNGPEQPNPFVRIPKAGDHIDFDDLMINYKVDEDLQNYLELYNWIRELGFPNSFDEYKSISGNPVYTGLGITSDMSLIILTSSRNPNYEVVFKDAFPISISSLIFDSTPQDVQYLEASATFRYRSYSIQKM
jgi:hypothetical protein